MPASLPPYPFPPPSLSLSLSAFPRAFQSAFVFKLQPAFTPARTCTVEYNSRSQRTNLKQQAYSELYPAFINHAMTGNLSDMSPANGGQTGGEGWGERRSGAGGEGMTIAAFDQVDDSQRQHEIQDGGGVDHFMRVASSDTPPGLARTLGGSKNGGTGMAQGQWPQAGRGRRRDAMSMPPEDVRQGSPQAPEPSSHSRTYARTYS